MTLSTSSSDLVRSEISPSRAVTPSSSTKTEVMLRELSRRWTDNASTGRRLQQSLQRQHLAGVTDGTEMENASVGQVPQTSASSVTKSVIGLPNAQSAEAEATVETVRETMTEERVAASSAEVEATSLESATNLVDDVAVAATATLMVQTAEEVVVATLEGDAHLLAETIVGDALAQVKAVQEGAEATLLKVIDQEEEEEIAVTEAKAPHKDAQLTGAAEEANHLKPTARARLQTRREEATDLAQDQALLAEAEALTPETRGQVKMRN